MIEQDQTVYLCMVQEGPRRPLWCVMSVHGSVAKTVRWMVQACTPAVVIVQADWMHFTALVWRETYKGKGFLFWWGNLTGRTYITFYMWNIKFWLRFRLCVCVWERERERERDMNSTNTWGRHWGACEEHNDCLLSTPRTSPGLYILCLLLCGQSS